MGTKTKRRANATIVFLYLMILFLPFLFSIQNDWLVFLEQPLFILLPSLLTAFFYLRTKEDGCGVPFPGKRPDLYTVGLLAVIVFLLYPIINFVAEQFLFFVTEYLQEEFLFVPSATKGWTYALMTFFYGTFYFAVFPGICEEFLFRGVLLTLMREAKWKTPMILLVNAFLFGLFHFNLEQFFYTTVMGLVLTAVVLITNSLYAGIFLHILYNFTVSLPDILYIESGSALDSFMGYVYNTDTWLPALLSTGVILTILLHFHKKENGVRLNLIK